MLSVAILLAAFAVPLLGPSCCRSDSSLCYRIHNFAYP
jgi:hypothetical protein